MIAAALRCLSDLSREEKDVYSELRYLKQHEKIVRDFKDQVPTIYYGQYVYRILWKGRLLLSLSKKLASSQTTICAPNAVPIRC